MCSFGTEPQQAVVSWFSLLLIARSCMHDIYVCCGVGWRLGSSSAEIECSNESSGQHTASECASHPRRTTGLAETAGARRWVSSKLVSTEKPERLHYLEQGDLHEKFPRFNNIYYCCTLLYQYRHCRRPPWEKRKIRYYDHLTLTLTLTLTRTLWGDQCLDAVACEGSRLIRATWFLCVERLLR